MPGKRHHLAAVLLLLAGCAGQDEPVRVTEPRTTGEAAARGPALLRTTMLDAQNRARAAVGVAPLIWDETLVASARGYAETLARSGRFEHAAQPQGAARQGEALWTGTRDAYSFSEMTGHWLAERRLYTNLPVPMSSTSGKFGDVSHYSQIVWRNSARVGCALASNSRDDFLVCRYSPTGNVFGQRAY